MEKIEISKEIAMDAVCLSNGAFNPLKTFNDKEDYEKILNEMKIKSGKVWPIPILFLIEENFSEKLNLGEEISLFYNSEEIARLNLKEKYKINKEEYCKKIFNTESEEHPGVMEIKKQGNIALSGDLKLIKNPFQNKYELSPKQVKKLIKEKGFKTLVAFHTRNPIHRSHEFLQRSALEFVDGLFVQPVIGKKKIGDFKEEYIIKSYEIMIEKFYPKDRVLFSTLSTYSRYAGPREAVFTALVRRNFGATHFIVGRDHTGVKDFYGKYDSQKIFDNLGNIGIKIVKFHAPFYCKTCKQYVTEHTCTHKEEQIDISGTEIRNMLNKGIFPSEEIMRKEISEMITNAIKRGEKVFVD